MIGLNKIGLNQVLLNRLRLNAPFPAYGKMAGGGGSGDGFPQLPGDVTRWHFGGLTNEMMAAMDDPRIEDADHKGRFLSFKNFLWAGMSGVGGYSDEIVQTTFKFTSDKYNMAAIKSGFKHMNFMFKVTGLQPGNKLTLMYAGDSSSVTIYGNWTNDGIYVVNTDIKNIGKPVYFYNGYSAVRGTFIIEIFPLYPGFILGDGVDDFAVTEKELNFEDTYTVYTAFIPFGHGLDRFDVLCGKDRSKDFYVNCFEDIRFYTAGGFGALPLHVNQFTVLLCKRNGTTGIIKNLITGESAQFKISQLIDNPGLYYLWRSTTIFNYARAAIAGQAICNGYFSTDEDDEKVLNYYKQEYPWLFPDQAWTVVGKTNEDEDRATIANITGNGNDLVCLNLGFIEGSGYNEEGEYAGYLVTDGVDDKITSSTFEMGNDWTVIGDWELINTGKNDNAGIVKFDSIVIYNYNPILINIKNGRNNLIPDQNTVNAICSDGRIYSKDWKESIYNEETESTSKNLLTIGYSGNSYTKIAFKNLAIYPTVLSKEDCIKAYNYLQTLKAK